MIHRHRLDPSQCIYVGTSTQDVAFARRLGFRVPIGGGLLWRERVLPWTESVYSVVAMTRLLSDVLRDVRFALRVSRREPALVWIAVLTMALGVGLTTTLFSVAQGAVQAAAVGGCESSGPCQRNA